MLFGLQGLTVYGPVPTGCGSANVSGCTGTMPTRLAKYQKYGCAVLANCMVTWLPVAVTLCSPAPVQSEYRSVAGTRFIRSNVNATSCALNGCPSFHFTPDRMLKVIDFLSAPHV